MQTLSKLDRPEAVPSRTIRETVACGKIYVTVGKNNGDIVEIFAKLGKAGGCALAQLEGLTRTITLGLKYGIPVEEFIKELEGIKCPSPSWSEGVFVTSCPDAIAKVLEKEVGGKCGC